MTNINIDTMKKDDLIALVLENTDEYKKTHLVEMKKADILEIVAQILLGKDTEAPEQPEVVTSEAEQAAPEAKSPAHDETPDAGETPQEAPGEAAGAEQAPPAEMDTAAGDTDLTTEEIVAKAYDENCKKVKGPRIDKDEFKKTAIEKAIAALTGSELPAEIRAIVVQTIDTLLTDKSAFIPMNDTEKKMLATLPKMKDFAVDTAIVGKDWLDMVETQHEIPVSSTRALIVSLKKKKYISVKGRNSGEKITKVQLTERGIRYLTQSGALQFNEIPA